MEKILTLSFGIIAFLLSISAFIRYIYAINESLKKEGSIRPSNIVISLLFMLDVLLLVTYVNKNNWDAMAYMLLAYTTGALSLFITIVKYGTWKMNSNEMIESVVVIVGSMLGMYLWYHYKSAILGHYILIIINIIIFIPLIRKVYKEPWTEDLTSWLLWFTSNLFALLPLLVFKTWSIENGLLSIVYFILYLILIIPIFIFSKNKNFLKKHEVTTEFYAFGKSKKSSGRLTLVARHLGLIKNNEELREIYIGSLLSYKNGENNITRIRKEKTKEYCNSLIKEITDEFGIWDDGGFTFKLITLENIVRILHDGRYFSAKTHFKWESDKLLNQKEIYFFLKERFKD